ncbi:myosin-IIIa-like [Liasis olivaceus]
MHHPRETTSMKTRTVASYFRYSLMDLLSKMVVGQPRFVRCIKPNNDRQANKYNKEKVLVQLRYAGILETARIRQQGYSHRILFANFIKRYYFLCYKSSNEPPISPATCTAILEKAQLDNWMVGKTKVFLKYYHVEQLNLMRKETINRIVLIQAYVRKWLRSKRYKMLKEKREASAIKIQSAYRGYATRKEYANAKNIDGMDTWIIKLQAVTRGFLIQKGTKEINDAAITIQSHFRGYRERTSFKRKRESLLRKRQAEMATSPREKENLPEDQNQPTSHCLSKKVSIKSTSEPSQQGSQERSDPAEKNQGRVAPQESHLTRGSLEYVRPTPYENKAPLRSGSARGSQKHIEASQQATEDIEKAALVIQSNYREYQKRDQLRKEGKLSCENQDDCELGTLSDDLDQVLIDGPVEEKTSLAAFSKQISTLSEDYLSLQQKLNEIILSHQLSPMKLSSDYYPNNHLSSYVYQSVGFKRENSDCVQRSPRRSQNPKTLNHPEDSTYYTLLHKFSSMQDEKQKARKNSLGKLLDIEDRYYQEFSSTDFVSKDRNASTRGKKTLEDSRAATLRIGDRPKVTGIPLQENKDEDHPYDYQKLLRKTSQRRRLIQQY